MTKSKVVWAIAVFGFVISIIGVAPWISSAWACSTAYVLEPQFDLEVNRGGEERPDITIEQQVEGNDCHYAIMHANQQKMMWISAIANLGITNNSAFSFGTYPEHVRIDVLLMFDGNELRLEPGNPFLESHRLHGKSQWSASTVRVSPVEITIKLDFVYVSANCDAHRYSQRITMTIKMVDKAGKNR
jgi:hypothetical protein